MLTSHIHAEQFHGNDRFEIVRRIGAGGIGLVYEAIDQTRDARVAIKTLQALDGRKLLRFKSEFRMLQGIHHKNLIQLGELFEDRGLWFFTMELLHGVDFQSYVTETVINATEETKTVVYAEPRLSQLRNASLASDQHRPEIPAGGYPSTGYCANEARLRDVLRQLAEGLHALHRAGMVHRDIKPHNVMVCAGRVVVLDFGLVSEERSWHRHDMDLGRIVGTPAYMAPEQAAGLSATPASDWYGVGVMLYQALTGKRPFRGSSKDIIRAKQHREPPLPSQQVRNGWVVPPDLEALCMRLLHRDPKARPTGTEVLAQLGGVARASGAEVNAPDREFPLAGRNAELSALWEAFGRCGPGRAVPVFVQGASGMGKTTLLEYFARQVRDLADGLVLRGRCYEIETVPYKACDGVIDDLSRYLRGLRNVPNAPPSNAAQATANGGHDPVAEPETRLTATMTAEQQTEADGMAHTISCTGGVFGDPIQKGTNPESFRVSHQTSNQVPSQQWVNSMTREYAALRRLFPVIDLETSSTAVRDQQIRDPIELRHQAFTALKRLFAMIATQRPLVVFIDDLQWGDLDSVALLSELISPPEAPGLLLVLSHRSEEAQNVVITCLRDTLSRALGDREIVDIELGPLTASDCEVLAMTVSQHLDDVLGGPKRQRLPDLARIIAQESGGNPMFVSEMIRYVATSSAAYPEVGLSACMGGTEKTADVNTAALKAADPPAQPPTEPHNAARAAVVLTLDQILAARHQQLDDHARSLLEMVAVAAQPIPQSVALSAAGIGDAGLAAVATLRAERFVRTQGADSDYAIEIYHDRIRESVLAHLEQDTLRACHGRLATTLEASGTADAQILAGHFYRAGQLERATIYTIQAAQHAERVLAFDRAAQMYGLLLDIQEHMPGLAEDRRTLYIRLGEALSNAGHGAEAADAYLAAATAEPGDVPPCTVAVASAVVPTPASERGYDWAMECKRRAAEQLFRSGNFDRGLTILGDVLAANRLRIPRTGIGALASLIAQRLRLHRRGLDYQVRARNQISPRQLQGVEACRTAFVGMVMIDPIRGTCFATRHLRTSLQQGDEAQIALGLSGEGHSLIWREGKANAYAMNLGQRTIDIAKRIGDPLALGLGISVLGDADLCAGRWQRARDLLEHAEIILREQCIGAWFEVASIRIHESIALYYLGDWSRLSQVAGTWMRQALKRSDWYTVGVLAHHAAVGELCADDVVGARRIMRLSRIHGLSSGYRIAPSVELLGSVQVDLYARDLTAAWQRIAAELPSFRRSLLGRIPMSRARMSFLYARCALALCATQAATRSLVRIAAREARRLDREPLAWAGLLAGLVRAGVAACRGDYDDASARLQHVGDAFDRADMALFAAAARWQHGRLVGGDQGAAITAAAEAAMRARGIANPVAVAHFLAPGYPV